MAGQHTGAEPMSRLNREQSDSHPAAATFPVYLAYAVLVLLYFSPHLLGLASFSANDFTQLFLPFSMFQQDALLGLRLPVWDPHTNSGHPYLADPQAAVFYPVSNALLLLTGFVRGAAGRLYLLHVEAALHVFLACCFTYAFVRRLTGQRLAAFASGLIFGFSGYLSGYPPLQLSILRTAVWLPLILLLLLPRESRIPNWKFWLAAAAVHAVAFYGGHPQTFLFITYVVGGWILMLGFFELAQAGIRWRVLSQGIAGQGGSVGPLLRFSGRSLLYVAALIALCLAQLWPTWEFTQHSVRFFVPSDYLTGGFAWEDSWQFLFPGLLTAFSPQYVGIIGLGLALVAVVALFSPSFFSPTLLSPAPFVAFDKTIGRAPALFFIVCGVAAILLSYGAKGPLYGLFVRFAPGGDLFRGQERAIYVAVFSLSVLAGYGLALLPSLAVRVRRYLGWTLLGATLAGAVLVVFFWLIPSRSSASVSSFLVAAVPALLLAACFARLCGAKRIRRSGLLLLLPLLVGDLFLANFATNLSDGPRVRAALDSNVAQATLDASRALAGDGAGPAPRVFNEFRLQDSSGIFFGWEDVWGSSPMRLFYYDTLFHTFPLHRMWELTGVGTVLSWREELPVASRTLVEVPVGEETSRIHQLDAISPRWWWAQNARRNVADRDAPALLADPDFDLKSEILVAETDAHSLGTGWENDRLSLGNDGSASVRAVQVGLAHLIFEIDSDQEGLLFVSENWLPGWKALWSDGQAGGASEELPIVRAHQAFLGIPVPAGAGTLELRYRPDSVRWGPGISVVAWAALLFAMRAFIWKGLLFLGNGIVRLGPAIWGEITSATRGVRGGTGATRSAVEDSGARVVYSEAQQDGRRIWPVFLILVTLFGFALRLFRLGFQELNPVEFDAHILNTVSWAESTDLALDVILSLVVQRMWHMLVGSSEFALRSVNAFAGTAAIVLAYVFARHLRLRRSIALMSSLLMAASAFAVWHSQNAEAGMLILALTAASMILALRFIRIGGSLGSGAGLVVGTAAALYTSGITVMILLVQNLYVAFILACELRNRQIGRDPQLPGTLAIRWLVAQVAIVALTLPWFLLPWPYTWFDGEFSSSFSLSFMFLLRLGLLFLGNSVPHSIWHLDAGVLTFAAVIAAVLAPMFGRNGVSKLSPEDALPKGDEKPQLDEDAQEIGSIADGNRGLVLLLLYIVIPMVGAWIVGSNGALPSIEEQLTVAALMPFVILMSTGFAAIGGVMEKRLGWRWRTWTADPTSDGPTALTRVSMGHVATAFLVCLYVAGNLFSLSNHYFDPSYGKSRGLRELASRIEQWGRGLAPAEVQTALSIKSDYALPYYHPISVGHTYVALGTSLGHSVLPVETLSEQGYRRVLVPVPTGGFGVPNERPLEELSRQYSLATTTAFDHWSLHLFSRPDPQLWRPLEVSFVNGLTLTSVQVEPDYPPEGGMLVIHLEWSGDPERLTGGEKAFLHLLDEEGNLIAQWDPELRMDSSPQTVSAAIEVPADLPPRRLRLIGGLYDVSVEGAPRIATDSGDDSLTLFSFPERE